MMARMAIWFLFLLVYANLAARGAPLDGLPSEPGPHVEKIRNLGDGEWLHLGAPAPDPKWGRARGRSWGAKMPYSSELHAAFLCGEGVHGWWNEQTGRYMDDLWVYDILGHRWICAYPGVEVKTIDLVLDENGFETTQEGRLIPVAELGHAYENVTYDNDLKKFMFMPCPAGYEPFKEKRQRWLKGRKENSIAGASPFLYDVAADRWERHATKGPSPRSSFGHVLMYLPEQKRAFFWGSGAEVWYYTPAANEWSMVTPAGPAPPYGIDPTATLDTKRGRIHMGGGSYPVPEGNSLWIYDLRSDTWIDPGTKNKPGGNDYNTNAATMAYDSVADVVIVNRFRGEPEQLGVFVYDPRTNAWSGPTAPPQDAHWECVNACYDRLLNVHIFHSANDSEDDGTIWVYRHKKSD